MFIKRPDRTATIKAENQELSAKVRLLEAQLKMSQAEVVKVKAEAEPEPVECDVCELGYTFDEACRRVADLQSRRVNDLNDHLCQKFSRLGLGEIYNAMSCALYNAEVIAEWDAAIAGYNLAMCKAEGAEDGLDCLKDILIDAMQDPTLDPTCAREIRKVLACVC